MQQLTFAQKAKQILVYDKEIDSLRVVFNELERTDGCTIFLDVLTVHQNRVAEISDAASLKAWINDYMPTIIAKRDALTDEINQYERNNDNS